MFVLTIKILTIRIEENLLHKLHVVSAYEARSANSQINILIRNCVDNFEKEYGKIKINK